MIITQRITAWEYRIKIVKNNSTHLVHVDPDIHERLKFLLGPNYFFDYAWDMRGSDLLEVDYRI